MKSNPLWVTCLVGGVNPKNGEVFLGSSDFHGTRITNDWIISALGNHYCQVLFGNRWRIDMSYEEAVSLIEDCMRILFLKDKKAADTI